MVRTQYPGSLHGHTEYSNLDIRDSTNRIEDLMTRAAIELGQEVIAFTEHETVCNAIKIEKVYKDIVDFNAINQMTSKLIESLDNV